MAGVGGNLVRLGPERKNPKSKNSLGAFVLLMKSISFEQKNHITCGYPLQEAFCVFIKGAFIKVGSKGCSGSHTRGRRRIHKEKKKEEGMRKQAKEEEEARRNKNQEGRRFCRRVGRSD